MAPPHRFVADMMLGKLARWLRAMGYDTVYFRVAEDRHLLQLAHAEARTLLTRDTRLARLAGAGGLLIQATEVEP
ncbi:MAG: Mut7-C RNAse domain-containing protein, partial [candidate division NC10 bacterium]